MTPAPGTPPRVRLREVARAYGPAYTTVRRALESGWFASARLELVPGSTVPTWTVTPTEIAWWYAERAPGDASIRRSLYMAYLDDIIARFVR